MKRELEVAQALVDMSKDLERNYPEPTNLQTYMALDDFKKNYSDWADIKEEVFKIARNLYSSQQG